MIRTLTIALLLSICAPAAAHPFHMSVGEAEYNSSTKSLEVAVRVHPIDLEAVLRRQAGKRVDLDKTDNIDKLIQEYLKSTFRLKRDEKNVPFTWVGKELTNKWVWLYFEFPVDLNSGKIELRNELFFDHLSDQINTIHVKHGRRKVSLNFHRKKRVIALSKELEGKPKE